VPEGFYAITQLNPWSSFHLSLRVDYPNRADRRRSQAKDLGGDIFIHGNCVTIGCLPLQDGPIEALYVAVLDAKAAGAEVEAHLFPARMDEAWLRTLEGPSGPDTEVRGFWDELRGGYTAFEATRVLPGISVDAKGRYVVKPR
jgi:murein L,D-transpeptidase YafK